MAKEIVLDDREWKRSFITCLKNMQECGLLCDIAIQCTDEDGNSKPIPAHACVLAASSPLLKSIVIKEDINSETGVKHVDSMGFGDTVWRFLLEFMYTSRVVIPAEQRHYLLEIEEAAMHLSVKGLIDAVTLEQTKGDDTTEGVTETGDDSSQDVLDAEDSSKQPPSEVEQESDQEITVEESAQSKSPAKRKSVRLMRSGRKKRRKMGNLDDDFEYSPNVYIKQEHVCSICHGVFKSRRPLQQHMKKFHPEHKRHFCKQCNAPFNTPLAVEDHRRKEHGAKLLECVVCYKEFYTRDAWRRHIRLYHPKIASARYEGDEEAMVKDETSMDNDSKEQVLEGSSQEGTEAGEGEGETMYATIQIYNAPTGELEVVEQTFALVDEMGKPVSEAAGVSAVPVAETEPPADVPGADVPGADVPDAVVVDPQPEPQPEPTVVKPRRGRGRPPKIKQEKVDPDLPFKCTECPKVFETQNGLTAHQHHCHPDVYRGKHVCSVCDRSFGQPAPLEDHMRQRHGAEKLRCDMCDKTFVTRDALYRHERFKHNTLKRRLASKLRRFECGDCGEDFQNVAKLEDHQRKEHGAPPLICETCGMEFVGKDTLYRHTRYMHGDTSKDAVSLAALQNLTEEEKARHEEAVEWRKQNCKYQCEQCDYVAVSKHMLDEHIRKHSDKKEYQCTQCDKEFKYKVGLLNHNAKHHPETFAVTHSCSECNAVFGRQVYLEDHCRKKHNAPLLECEYCDKTHYTFDAMYRHKRYDHPTKQKRRIKVLHKCDYCSYTSLSKGGMANHQLKHTNVRAFICELCGMDFKYKGDLVKHNRQAHQPDYQPPVFHCDVCGLECKNKSILQRHFVSRHEKAFTRSFPCPECNQEYGSKTNRDDHIRFDHNGEEIQCQFCKQKFTDVNVWYAHKQKEHPELASRVLLSEDLYACGICHKQFRKIPLLRRHERYHVTVRPFKCDVCGCSFVAKEDLKAHAKVHSGEKPYACQFCPFTTLRKPALSAHMRVHDESQHLQCPSCERKYVNAPSLRKHLRSAHGVAQDEEQRIMDAMTQHHETVYLKIEDGETLVADSNDVVEGEQTQVYHIQDLGEVAGHEIQALIQDPSTLIKAEGGTGEVQELIVADPAAGEPQYVVQEQHDTVMLQQDPQMQDTQQQVMQQDQQQIIMHQDQQQIIQQDHVIMQQQELITTDAQQFEGELESVVTGVDEDGGGGEQQVVYIMADEEGGESQATGQMIQAKDENGQEVLYFQVGENQYIQMDAESLTTT